MEQSAQSVQNNKISPKEQSVQTTQLRTINNLISHKVLTYLDDEPIGSGAFGDVYKTFHNHWGCQVAFKRLDIRQIRKSNNAEQK